MRLNRQQQLLLGATLITYAVTLRLLPHPSNFAPLTAVAIFGGVHLSRRQAVATALVAAIVSDALIGFYTAVIMLTVWACYGLIALASHQWLKRPDLLSGALFTLAGSSFFFTVSNFAVWAAGGLYPHTAAGLVRCYVRALPFFRNSLAGDLCYTGLLFAAYAAVNRIVAERLHVRRA